MRVKVSGAAKETFGERGRMLGRKETGEIQRPGGPAKNVETQGLVTREDLLQGLSPRIPKAQNRAWNDWRTGFFRAHV